MSRLIRQAGRHEQTYLMSELESLGMSTIRLNEFNSNEELKTLVNAIKQELLAQYRQSVQNTR